jgi:hypothetical protein
MRTYSIKHLGSILAQRALVAKAATGGEWLGFQAVSDAYGFSRDQLYAWSKEECPYLGGKRLKAKTELLNIDGRRIRGIQTYQRDQLEQIRKEMSLAEEGVHTDAQGRWLTARSVRLLHGDSRLPLWATDLVRWRSAPCRLLGGRTIRAKRVRRPGGGRGSYGDQVWVYHESDVVAIATARRERPDAVFEDGEGLWLFASAVEERYGLPADNLWYYRRKYDGRLRAIKVPATEHPRQNESSRMLWVYHEADLRRCLGLPVAPPREALPVADGGKPFGHEQEDRTTADEVGEEADGWSRPKSPTEWAGEFDVHYNTMIKWLRDQTVRNRQVSPRRYQIAVCELP